MAVANNDNNKGVTFRGNIYTGDKDVGIKVESQNAAYFYSPTIISRGSLDLLGGATVSLQGEKSSGKSVGTEHPPEITGDGFGVNAADKIGFE